MFQKFLFPSLLTLSALIAYLWFIKTQMNTVVLPLYLTVLFYIHTEAWPSGMGIGRGANNPTL
jgi:uncharacterized membrane protein